MLAVPNVNRFSFYFTNQATPTGVPGTSVVPGASNVEGSWTEVASAADIAQDIYLITVFVSGGATSGQAKPHLLDIGWDPAGGTSYVEQIANICCGGTASPAVQFVAAAGVTFQFPIFIKAGSAVAVRCQGANATAGTIRVQVEFFGQPSHPEIMRVGQYSETIGTITNSNGVSFTPGTTPAEGAWVSLGTTTRPLWWWQLAVQMDSAASNNRNNLFDLAYGDGSNKVIIIENLMGISTNGEVLSCGPQWNCFCEVPAGGELFVRGSGNAADTYWNAVAVGIGG